VLGPRGFCHLLVELAQIGIDNQVPTNRMHSSGKKVVQISPTGVQISPTAPESKRHSRTVFHQTSSNWRRLSTENCDSGIHRDRNLVDLTVFELLDAMKSLSVPLKARKCLETVGVSGQDFFYYTDRDLEQIGVCRQDIKEKVLGIKQKIFDNDGKVPGNLFQPSCKRERLKQSWKDPFRKEASLAGVGVQENHKFRSRRISGQEYQPQEENKEHSTTLRKGTLHKGNKEEMQDRGGGARTNGSSVILDLNEVSSKLEAIKKKNELEEMDDKKEGVTRLPEITGGKPSS
jgi:hypothetical protein